MRKLLGTLVVLMIAFCLIGLARGWFAVTTNSESEKTKIEMTIDRQKLQQDTDRLKEGVQEFSGKIKSDG